VPLLGLWLVHTLPSGGGDEPGFYGDDWVISTKPRQTLSPQLRHLAHGHNETYVDLTVETKRVLAMCGHGRTRIIFATILGPSGVSVKHQGCAARRTYVTLWGFFRRPDLPSHGRHIKRWAGFYAGDLGHRV